jgi:integrase
VRESTGTDNETKAWKFLQQRQAEVRTGNHIPVADRNITIDELYAALLDEYRANERASLASTEARWNDSPTGRLKLKFSGMKAMALTTDKLNQYATWCREQGLENATINRDLAALRRAFKLALKAKKIREIPSFPRFKEAPPRDGFLEPADYLNLTEHAHELWLRAILACLSMGMRLGEVVGDWHIRYADGMKVRHVDLLGRTIRLKNTKNGDDRTVPMTQELYTLMTLCCAGKGPDDFVFTREDGIQVKSFRKRWQNLLRDAGVRTNLLIHDNRRSAARNLRRAGVQEGVIMKAGGWKTRSVFDRYNIVNEEDLHDAAQKLDAAKKVWAQNRHILDENAPKTGSDEFQENDVNAIESKKYN